MSYSFNVTAATKEAVKKLARIRFNDIVARDAIHAKDQAIVFANMDAVLSVLHDDPEKDVSVSVNGYLGTVDVLDSPRQITSVGVSCSAGLIARHVL